MERVWSFTYLNPYRRTGIKKIRSSNQLLDERIYQVTTKN
jgi:hypothetical protein